MSVWTATTLVLSIAAGIVAGTADAQSCGPKNQHRCANSEQKIDLNSVSDITNKIVGAEPITQRPNRPKDEPAAPSPYSGPIFGATTGKRTPIVGYSWQLE